MGIEQVFRAHNWLFIVPIGLATLFILLQLLGFGLLLGGGDVDGPDIDGPEVDGPDFDGLELADAGMALQALNWFHVGRTPMSMLLSVFCFSFGFGGLFATTFLERSWGWSSFESLTLGGFAAALVVGLALTKVLGGVLAKLMPSVVTKSVSPSSLVGELAGVDSAAVTGETGRGHIIDGEGDLHTVFLRLTEDVTEPVSKGARVRLVRYRARDGVYLCRPEAPEGRGPEVEG